MVDDDGKNLTDADDDPRSSTVQEQPDGRAGGGWVQEPGVRRRVFESDRSLEALARAIADILVADGARDGTA